MWGRYNVTKYYWVDGPGQCFAQKVVTNHDGPPSTNCPSETSFKKCNTCCEVLIRESLLLKMWPVSRLAMNCRTLPTILLVTKSSSHHHYKKNKTCLTKCHLQLLHFFPPNRKKQHTHTHTTTTCGILLMEEIPNNQLGRKNPCKYWNKLPTKWLKIYKISSINSTIPLQLACNNLFAKHRYHNELEIERRNWPEYFGPSQVKPTRNQDTVKETTRNTFWGSWSVVWNLVMFWRWSFIIYSNKKKHTNWQIGDC